METIDYNEVKARKEHTCNFCGNTINQGERYLLSTHKEAGEFYRWKAHIRCSEIADKLGMYDDNADGLTQECFQETIHCVYADLSGSTRTATQNIPFADKLNFVLAAKGIPKTDGTIVAN